MFHLSLYVIIKQSNQSYVLDPEAERILEDRLYREEMEFLIAQELLFLKLMDIYQKKTGTQHFWKEMDYC